MAAGLIGGLAIVLVLMVCGMFMRVRRVAMMAVLYGLGCMGRMALAAARRRSVRRQCLQWQGQHQQPDGNQSRESHRTAV